MSKQSDITLKSRAVAYLSRREHSKLELTQKLQPYVEDQSEIQDLLVYLEHGGWQSDERFALSLANRRIQRYGWQRLQHELQQHQIDESIINNLKNQFLNNEKERAFAVWQKKFNNKPEDSKQYAKQYRFMAGRGFASNIIHKILNS